MVGKDLIMATLFGGGSSGSGGGGSAGVKITHGSYISTENITLDGDNPNIAINHGLGVIPDLFIFMCTIGENKGQANALDMFMYSSVGIGGEDKPQYYSIKYSSANSSWRMADISTVSTSAMPTTTIMPIGVFATGSQTIVYPVEYRWIAIGGLSE